MGDPICGPAARKMSATSSEARTASAGGCDLSGREHAELVERAGHGAHPSGRDLGVEGGVVQLRVPEQDPGLRRRRSTSRLRHLRPGRRRADRAALPRRRAAAWRSRRRRRRDVAPLDDHLPPPATRCRGVRRDHLRHPALAQRGGCRRFRPADRSRYALADHRRTVLAVARPGHRAAALARRTYPLPRRGKRGMGIGGLR
jgi:hypothetical protein